MRAATPKSSAPPKAPHCQACSKPIDGEPTACSGCGRPHCDECGDALRECGACGVRFCPGCVGRLFTDECQACGRLHHTACAQWTHCSQCGELACEECRNVSLELCWGCEDQVVCDQCAPSTFDLLTGECGCPGCDDLAPGFEALASWVRTRRFGKGTVQRVSAYWSPDFERSSYCQDGFADEAHEALGGASMREASLECLLAATRHPSQRGALLEVVSDLAPPALEAVFVALAAACERSEEAALFERACAHASARRSALRNSRGWTREQKELTVRQTEAWVEALCEAMGRGAFARVPAAERLAVFRDLGAASRRAPVVEALQREVASSRRKRSRGGAPPRPDAGRRHRG